MHETKGPRTRVEAEARGQRPKTRQRRAMRGKPRGASKQRSTAIAVPVRRVVVKLSTLKDQLCIWHDSSD
jgi:hypothetical protein